MMETYQKDTLQFSPCQWLINCNLFDTYSVQFVASMGWEDVDIFSKTERRKQKNTEKANC